MAPCRYRRTSGGRREFCGAPTPSTALPDRGDPFRGRATAASTMLSQPVARKFAQNGGSPVSIAEEPAEAVGHAGVRITTDPGTANRREPLDRASHEFHPEQRVVEPHAQGRRYANRVIKRLDRLGGERSAIIEENRPRDHHRAGGCRSSQKNVSIAKRLAFITRVSNAVSASKISTPPATRPSSCAM